MAFARIPLLLNVAHGCGQTIHVGSELAAKLGLSVALSRGRESVFEARKKEADRGVTLLSREAFQPDANGADVLDQSTVRSGHDLAVAAPLFVAGRRVKQTAGSII
jgi:hypothetical protein